MESWFADHRCAGEGCFVLANQAENDRLRDTAIQGLADELPEEERDFIKQINRDIET